MKRAILWGLFFWIVSANYSAAQTELEWAIEPQFDKADPFSEGLAVVYDAEDGFVIDTTGRIVCTVPKYMFVAASFAEKKLLLAEDAFRYYRMMDTLGKMGGYFEEMSLFSEGLSAVLRDGLYGYMRHDGQYHLPPRYFYAGIFSEGLAKVGIPRQTQADEEGIYLSYGYINSKGKQIIPYKYDEAGDFRNGLAAVAVNHQYGYINRKGKLVVPLQYQRAAHFAEGLALVTVSDTNTRYIHNLAYDQKMGFVNSKGTVVIPFQWFDARSFSEGLAAVMDSSGRWGYIRPDGQWAIPPQYESAMDFQEGMAVVVLEPTPRDRRYLFIDTKGLPVFGTAYFISAQMCSDGMAAAKVRTAEGQTLWGYLRSPIAIPK